MNDPCPSVYTGGLHFGSRYKYDHLRKTNTIRVYTRVVQ